MRDEATAQSVRFLGSPTVQIDGIDVEATARSSKDFGMMCRTYGDSGKRVGIPPIDLIRAALRKPLEESPARTTLRSCRLCYWAAVVARYTRAECWTTAANRTGKCADSIYQ